MCDFFLLIFLPVLSPPFLHKKAERKQVAAVYSSAGLAHVTLKIKIGVKVDTENFDGIGVGHWLDIYY